MNLHIYIVSLILIGFALIVTDSRAAWLGIAISLSYLFMKTKKIKLTKQILILSLITSTAILLSLTIYKPNSAKGRLTIWQISTQMIKEQCFKGNGLTSFRRNYMYKQADFIKENSNVNLQMQPTNNGYAFNEFLRLAYEQGFVGLLIVGSILFLLFMKYIYKESLLFTCLISFIVFACFSYPCDIFLFLILLVIMIGSLTGNNYIIKIHFYYNNKIPMALCLIAAIFLGVQYSEKIRLEKELSKYFYQGNNTSLNYLQQHYNSFKYSADFVFRYAKILYLRGEYDKAVPVLKQAITLYPTTDKYCDLGTAYQNLKKYQEAENAYQCATQLLPNLILPYYHLFLLYKETGNKQESIKIAQKILAMPTQKGNKRYKSMIHIIKMYLSHI